MSVAAEEFLIKLSQQVSGPAGQAGGALAKLEAQIRAEERALGTLEGKLGSATAKLAEMMEGAGKGSVSLDAITKQRAAIAALQAQIEADKGSLGGLQGARGDASGVDSAKAQAKAEVAARKDAAAASRAETAEKRKADQEARKIAAEGKKRANEAKRTADEQKRAQAEATAENVKALGPLGGLAERFSTVAGTSGAAVGALLTLVAVLAAITVGAFAAAAALTEYALRAADAARMTRLFDDAAAGSVARGSELNKVVSDIATRVPLARAKIAEFGRQLELAGISGRRMQVALEMISAIESVIPGAGAKIEGLIERFQRLKRATLTKADLVGTGLALVDVAAQLAKGMGITIQAATAMLQNGTASVDKVMDAMRKAVDQKFGKTIASMMMSLTVQFEKLKENIGALFGAIDLEPFLAALKTITDLFGQNTVMGRVLKEVLGSVFTGVFDTMAKMAPLVVAFLKGFAIGALQVYIALKPIGKALAEAFGGADKADAMAQALHVGKTAAMMIGEAIGYVANVVLTAVSVFRMFRNAAMGISGGFDSIGAAMGKLPTVLDALIGQFASAGAALIQGFIQGIMGGVGAAMAAVASLGASVEQALRNAIGWHSPATLGVDAAGAIGEGFQQEAGAQEGKTSDAAGKMINPKMGGKDGGAGGGKKVLVVKKLIVGDQDDWNALRAFFGNEIEFQAGT